MRNLTIVEHRKQTFDSGLPLAATAWDTVNDALICAFGPTELDQVIELRRVDPGKQATNHLLASWDAPSPHPELSVDKILNLHHFSHNDTTCLVLAGGDIVVVRSQPTSGQDKIEIVGSVDAGIAVASWSPDEELLAIATKANTFLYMTTEFECISNVTFSQEDGKLSKHVSVGWGKAETQFKGKRARALRDPTMPEKVDEGVLSATDAGEAYISWRGDGAFVAVNSVEGVEKSRRMIRVYSRDGQLDSVSEPVDGLEGTISWRPYGNLIAGLKRLENSVQVVFFERNGLRHGDFDLRLSVEDQSTWAQSISLQWNTDSSVLAVTFTDRIQLWTMGNYHYYLKQEVKLSSSNSSCACIWHPEEPLRVAVSLEGSTPGTSEDATLTEFPSTSVSAIRLVSDVSSGSSVPPHDLGMTAVTDGKSLRLTPLRTANVPPPMALHEIDLQQNARHTAINLSDTALAVLHETSVSVIRDSSDGGALRNPSVSQHYDLPSSAPFATHQLSYLRDEGPYVLLIDSAGSDHVLYDCSSQTSEALKTSGTLLRLQPDVGHKDLYLQSDQDILRLTLRKSDDQDSGLTMESIAKFSTPVSSFQVVEIEDTPIAFGLTSSGSLFANDRPLLRNCTSFIVTDAHLIVTTSNHLLKFVHVSASVDGLEVPADEPEKDERCRSIERGAKLVAVMPTTSAVVLQMPRGNLETIYPRALVLAAIRRSINAKDYRAAFLTCRSQRVDMNIIHDHAPEQFLNNVELILKQLKKAEHVDLLLSQLGPEDVSQTIYKDTLPLQSLQNGIGSEQSKPANTNKVNNICDAFLKALRSSTSPAVQNIITAHLCKTPPDIEAGLKEVAKLTSDSDSVEMAVEHLCFLADVNRVYDAALGLYDLNLTILVAQQSQKDPREYLPYLQGLQTMTQLERQYTINNDLGRREKALTDLYSIGDFDRLTEYVKRHELYPQALEIYKYDDSNYRNILGTYADFLNERNRYQDAAIAYESLSDYATASNAYKAVNLWRESLSCAQLAGWTPDKVASLAQSLAEGLEEAKEYYPAGCIHREYLSDIPSALRLLCKAYHFAEAISLAAQQAQPALLPAIVDPGLAEGAATLTEMLSECKGQVAAQVPRLRELRAIRAADPLAFFEGADLAADVPDNVSLAPSAASTTGNTFMTRYTQRTGTGTLGSGATRRTSKNKRREERKRARGKKGSVYEEEYLVNSLGRLAERVNDVGGDVRSAVDACLRRGMREQAKALEAVMLEVVEACRDCLDEVFETQAHQQMQLGNQDGEGMRPGGADGVFWDSMAAARQGRVAPTVKAFEAHALLK